MHRSVLEFAHAVLSPAEVEGKLVLDVGARNVNGTLRDVVMPHKPRMYIGIDIEDGPGVDLVLDVLDAPDVLRPGGFDVVLCAGTLGYIDDWGGALKAMVTLLRRRGVLLLTVRGLYSEQRDLPASWRFTEADLRQIFEQQDIIEIVDDPMQPALLCKIIKRNGKLNLGPDVVRM